MMSWPDQSGAEWQRKYPDEANYIETDGLKEYLYNLNIKTATMLKHNWPDIIVRSNKEKICSVALWTGHQRD